MELWVTLCGGQPFYGNSGLRCAFIRCALYTAQAPRSPYSVRMVSIHTTPRWTIHLISCEIRDCWFTELVLFFAICVGVDIFLHQLLYSLVWQTYLFGCYFNISFSPDRHLKLLTNLVVQMGCLFMVTEILMTQDFQCQEIVGLSLSDECCEAGGKWGRVSIRR